MSDIMKEVLVKKLGDWVANSPDPDKIVFLKAGGGGGTSVRDLLHSVQQDTPDGKDFVQQYVEQFVEFVNKK